jgi:hypothetical protein
MVPRKISNSANLSMMIKDIICQKLTEWPLLRFINYI